MKLRAVTVVLAFLVINQSSALAAPCHPDRALFQGRGKPVEVAVEIADSDEERARGLMFRRDLPAGQGMLFIYESPQPVSFWMRNTLIPLDIVYIRPDGRVLSIARNARPLDETPLPAGGQIRAVLELAGGRAAQIGLLPGDKVVHRIFAQ